MGVCVNGGININRLVGAAACCVCGLVSGGGRGRVEGGGWGGMVWGWHCWWCGAVGVGIVLAGGPGVPVGRVGVACMRRAVLAVPGWLRYPGVDGRWPHGRPVGAVVHR